MSKQPEPAKSHSEPLLCKTGCGFFGNSATGGYCSKCWTLVRPKDVAPLEKEGTKEPKKVTEDSVDICPVAKCTSSDRPETAASLSSNMECATETPPPTDQKVVTPVVTASPTKKKKKKKTSYKSMMAGMLEGNSASRDVEKEKEKLREVTGGGHFSKIDKI